MQHSLDNIHWKTLCPWLLLVDCLRLAFRLRIWLLASVALVLVLAADSLTLQFVESRPWEASVVVGWPAPDFSSDADTSMGMQAVDGLMLPLRQFAEPLLVLVPGGWFFGQAAAFLVLFAWQLIIWAAFGGAICRVAALALTRGEVPDLPHSFRFAKRNYRAFLSAPLMSFIGVLLLAFPLVILGLVMRIESLAFIAALLWPITLLIGLGIAFLAIGLAFGFPLMWAAVAVEETDAFDAISRAYAYVYQRPLKLLWYLLVATMLGWLGGVAVEVFLYATRWLAESAVLWGLGVSRIVPETDLNAAQRIISFWTAALGVLRSAYYYAYFWSAAVGIYLLLRRDIDSVQLDEVSIEEVEKYTPSPLVASSATAEVQPASS